jgi:hypothetical protein
MSGIIHSYYAVALAPAIAALVGAGLVDVWNTRARVWLGGIAVGAACLATAWFGSTLLDRTPAFYPGLGVAAIALAAVALVALIVASAPALAGRASIRRLAVAAAGLGICATLLAPAAYAVQTMNTGYGGGDPHPGPGTTDGFGGGGGSSGISFVAGSGGAGLQGGGAVGDQGATTSSALLQYLVANRGTAKWIVAVNSAQSAGTIELATGLPVMAMGGFTGSDPTPTLAQLKAYVASGELRFVMVGGGLGGGGGFGGGDTSSVDSWVASTCKAVTISGSTSSLYDCAGAA